MRLLIVCRQRLWRDVLKSYFATAGEIDVVGEAGAAREAYDNLELLDPDVVAVDAELPGQSGIDATRELKRRAARPTVVVLLDDEREDTAFEALTAGASGVVCKTRPASELVEAVGVAHRGGIYLASGFEHLADRRHTPTARLSPYEQLTARQRQIFRLVVQGYSNLSIARELAISVKTVETHRARLNARLGVHSAVELVRFAAQNGLMA